jgi:hypothetical protein
MLFHDRRIGKHVQVPGAADNDVEEYLRQRRNASAARQFLQANPEGGQKSFPKIKAWMGAMDHLDKYPGDLPLFEGTKGDEGTGKRGK